MISKSSEEYLKAIYILKKEKGIIRVTDIAIKMNCSKPNVTKQLSILCKNGYVEYSTYKKITITNKGINLCKELLKEEDIIYLFLNHVIGINNDNLKTDSSLIKNVISKETLQSITSYVYIKLGLNSLKCDFNIDSEKCRKCIIDNEVGESK